MSLGAFSGRLMGGGLNVTLLVLIGLAIAFFGLVLIVQGVQGQQGRLRSLGGTALIVGILVAVLSSAFIVVPAGNRGSCF